MKHINPVQKTKGTGFWGAEQPAKVCLLGD